MADITTIAAAGPVPPGGPSRAGNVRRSTSFASRCATSTCRPSDTGFWQAGIRHDDDPYRSAVEAALEGEEEGRWFCSVTRHWTLERPDPRGDVH
ncbi:MAG: hypothetical protein WA701_04965 [Solirubrobacterales bacterium]